MVLKYQKLNMNAVTPTRATEGSAGYDLYSSLDEPVIICPGERKQIPTGIAIELPNREMAALIYARSGLASKFGIAPANCVGVVDSDYRGEILVTLENKGNEDFCVEPQMRIAQMVIAPVLLPEWEETDALDDTKRGNNGFGSTGV